MVSRFFLQAVLHKSFALVTLIDMKEKQISFRQKKFFKWKLIDRNLPSFGAAKTRALLREAFNDWAKYAPLTFQEVSQNQKADFELAFIHRYHDDIRRFDGPGGTLAYAYAPPLGIIRFEAEEPWTDK